MFLSLRLLWRPLAPQDGLATHLKELEFCRANKQSTGEGHAACNVAATYSELLKYESLSSFIVFFLLVVASFTPAPCT